MKRRVKCTLTTVKKVVFLHQQSNLPIIHNKKCPIICIFRWKISSDIVTDENGFFVGHLRNLSNMTGYPTDIRIDYIQSSEISQFTNTGCKQWSKLSVNWSWNKIEGHRVNYIKLKLSSAKYRHLLTSIFWYFFLIDISNYKFVL